MTQVAAQVAGRYADQVAAPPGVRLAARVANDSANPDLDLLRDINGLARQAPHGVNRAMEAAGEYGLVALCVLLAAACWWRAARRAPRPEAPAAVAGVLWAFLAAGLAPLVNIPVRALVQRPRPYADHDGLDVLVRAGHHYAFVSDHAAVTGALAVGVFMVSRGYGAAAILLAVAEGFSRVYLGVQYPTDVVGGFALGAATVLLLAPAGLAVLTRLTGTVAASSARFLVVSRRAHPGPAPSASAQDPEERAPAARQHADDKGLAA